MNVSGIFTKIQYNWWGFISSEKKCVENNNTINIISEYYHFLFCIFINNWKIIIKKLNAKIFYLFIVYPLADVLGIISGMTAMTMYLSKNIPTTITQSAIFIAFGSIGVNVILAVVVDLLPTTFR